jgi:hypothetical protein
VGKPTPEVYPLRKPEREEEEEEEEEENVVDYPAREQLLVPKDDIMMMPYFLQKIAKRRNMFFEFIQRPLPEQLQADE